MKNMKTDYLILGGGCAGLGLAVNFINANVDKKIMIIEPRTEYTDDKTWSSWGVYKHQFLECISKEWTTWQVISDTKTTKSTSLLHPYQTIKSIDYYHYALEKINKAQNVELCLGVSADSLSPNDNDVTVSTSMGGIQANYVFDGRLPKLDLSSVPEKGFIQGFGGFEVCVNEPVFNPEIVTLMDFRLKTLGEIAFCYVLPFSEKRALIEPTFFFKNTESMNLVSREVFNQYITNYLLEHYGIRNFEVMHQEYDRLPMFPLRFNPRPHQRIYGIGIAGGCYHPHTTYAFMNIQRYNERLVQSFLTTPSSEITGFNKSNFISVLEAYAFSYRNKTKLAYQQGIENLLTMVSGDVYARMQHDCLTAEDLKILSKNESFGLFL